MLDAVYGAKPGEDRSFAHGVHLMVHDLSPLFFLLPVLGAFIAFHRGPLPGEPADGRFLDVDGVRVRFTDTEETHKPVVVMVHGFASTLDAWAPVVPALSKTHRIVRLDLKGFGWSERPPGDYSPQAQAKMLLRFLDLRGVRTFSIVGHSWGCSIALAATLAAPERVEKLAFYDAWVYEAQLPVAFHWARTAIVGEMMFGTYYRERPSERMKLAFHDKKHVTPELVAHVTDGLNRPGSTAAALAAVRGQRFTSMEARYRTLRQPTLLMWGREDEVAALRAGQRLAREMPNARLVVYPSCGHFPMIEAREASNHDLASFLAQSHEQAA